MAIATMPTSISMPLGSSVRRKLEQALKSGPNLQKLGWVSIWVHSVASSLVEPGHVSAVRTTLPGPLSERGQPAVRESTMLAKLGAIDF
jgi:hypothetical protein